MTTTLLTVDGLVHCGGELSVEDLVGRRAVVDRGGIPCVSIVDLLSIVRLDAEADVIRFDAWDGTNHVLRVAELLDGEVFVQLCLQLPPGSVHVEWHACLVSPCSGRSTPIASLHAMTFRAFVGME